MRGRGTSNGTPAYLQNLQNNVTGGAAGNVGPQGGAPATTLPMLSGALQGGPQVNPQADAALTGIGGIYNRGASQLGVGSIESLTPEELATFQQGITRLYGSQAAPAFLNQYQATRPQQTATRTAFF